MRGEEGAAPAGSRCPHLCLAASERAAGKGRVLALQGAPCVGYGERGALGTASPVRAVDGGAVGGLPLRRPRQLDVSRIGSPEPGMGGSGV